MQCYGRKFPKAFKTITQRGCYKMRRFPYLRMLATVCILSLTVQVAAPLFASPSTKGRGKSDSCKPFH